MEVQACGGFVEDKDGGLYLFDAEEISQLHTLVLASRQGGRRLPQLDVSQPYFLQGLELLHDFLLPVRGEELDGLVYGHFQYIVDVLSFVFHLQRVALEAFPVARLAFQHQVCHELHLYGHRSFALAFLASSAFGVEREITCRISHLFGKGLFGEELPDFIVGFHVGHRVASRRLAYRVLVYELDVLYHADVAFQRYKLTRTLAGFAVFPLQCLIENVAHQGALPRTAHSGHHRHHVERETHVDAFQVVFACAFHFDVVVPRAVRGGEGNGVFAQQVSHGVARASRLQVFHVAFVHDFASQPSGFGADVDDVVGGTDDFLVVLYHYHRIAQLLQLAQHFDKAVGVAAMQPDAGLV